MAFALTTFRAWPAYPGVPTIENGVQYAYFELTAAASNNIVDFGTDTSALWTDLDATTRGLEAHKVMKQIAAASSGVLGVSGPSTFPLVQVATPANAGEVAYTIVNNRPVISLQAASGLTSWAILITWRLDPPNERGYVADYSAPST